jgi:hypothetical protein
VSRQCSVVGVLVAAALFAAPGGAARAQQEGCPAVPGHYTVLNFAADSIDDQDRSSIDRCATDLVLPVPESFRPVKVIPCKDAALLERIKQGDRGTRDDLFAAGAIMAIDARDKRLEHYLIPHGSYLAGALKPPTMALCSAAGNTAAAKHRRQLEALLTAAIAFHELRLFRGDCMQDGAASEKGPCAACSTYQRIYSVLTKASAALEGTGPVDIVRRTLLTQQEEVRRASGTGCVLDSLPQRIVSKAAKPVGALASAEPKR